MRLSSQNLSTLLVWWVDGARRHAWLVVLLALVSAIWSVRYAATNLGVSTDTASIISSNLSWRQDYIAYKAAFPADIDSLIVVVSADTPELASQASRTLAAALASDRELVKSVDTPGAGEYFERHALLYLESIALADLNDRLAKVQPFLGTLVRDPSLIGFTGLLRQVIDARAGGEQLELVPFLDAVSDAAEASVDGRFFQVSWQQLMLDRPSKPTERRRIILVKPHLNWNQLFPADAVIERVHQLSREHELTPRQGVRVRITGTLAMEHEELETVVRGAERAGLLSLVLVSIVLVVGLRSLRLVVSSLLTLLAGLTWTAAFATAAVGHLNLISVAFAVLYIGLGIAYAIHYCLRYRELVGHGRDHGVALTETASDVGGSLVVCAITTGVGFYAFVPTDFLGVSELGIISGTGMFISLLASLSVLPALLTLMPLPARDNAPPSTQDRLHAIAAWPGRHRRTVLAGSLLLAAVACGVLPAARFDGNPVSLRDPHSESVATFLELFSDPQAAPWSVTALADDGVQASRLASELDALEPVAQTRTLEDFIPTNQESKLALIQDLDLILSLDAAQRAPPSPTPAAKRRQALDDLDADLRRLEGDPSIQAEIDRLRGALSALDDARALSSTTVTDLLGRFERSLLGGLAEQLRLLRLSLTADPVRTEDLPATLVERWVAADGQHRVAAYAKANLFDQEALATFLEAVRTVAPHSTGDPVVYVESAKVVVRAFQQAFVLALVLIVIILIVLLKRLRYVAQVMLPLLLAAMLTVAIMVTLGVPFNFANVIALPLLLGVGVDNGIHLVHRMRIAPPADGNVLETSTARAVVASALTTIFSFGNLAFSPHPGTASMGLVLSIGLIATLLSSLVVLPAMLTREDRAAPDGHK